MKVLNQSALGMPVGFAGIPVILFIIFVMSSVLAQDRRTSLEDRFKPQPQPSGESAAPPNVIVAPNEDYRIGPGDHIEIKVEDAPELLTRTRVNAKGNILMPHLNYVPVAGKTTEQLTTYITEKLRGGYLKKPTVSVATHNPKKSSLWRIESDTNIHELS